jgi:hypothetical protein
MLLTKNIQKDLSKLKRKYAQRMEYAEGESDDKKEKARITSKVKRKNKRRGGQNE